MEKKYQILQILKLLLIIICAVLYAWGGMEYKWLRRFVAPTVCGVGLLALSRDWRVLIKMPLLGMASSMGYGATELTVKILKRLSVGLAFGTAAGSYHIWRAITENKGQWLIVGLCMVVPPVFFILLGVNSPFNEFVAGARMEETFLGLIVYTMAIMPVQAKED